jgi:hypothetical protein
LNGDVNWSGLSSSKLLPISNSGEIAGTTALGLQGLVRSGWQVSSSIAACWRLMCCCLAGQLGSCIWVLELLLVKQSVPCDFFAGAGIAALVPAMWAVEAGGILRRRAWLYALHLVLVLAYVVSLVWRRLLWWSCCGILRR